MRKAAFEFRFNEALTPSHIPPLIAGSSDEKEMPLLLEVFTTGNVHLLLSWGQSRGVFPNWTSDLFPSRGRTAPVP